MVRVPLHLGILLAMCAPGRAEPVRLRMAAVAPEGSEWARELHATSREVATATGGEVQIKWYLGGIAGDELAALARVRRGQLDGMGGASFCVRLAPSLRALQVFELGAQSRDLVDRLSSRVGH
jgi:TRAP-type C4-dicarboxylate transport system substrate-binding protein